MSDYVLTAGSTADLTAELFEQIRVPFIGFHFELGDGWYIDDCGKTLPMSEFYSRMAAGEVTKTSQPNVQEYEDFFRSYLDKGMDIIHIELSSGISGAFNSASLAASTLSEDYPDRKILVIDSLAASSGYGLLVYRAAEMRDEGLSLQELYDWTMNARLKVYHWFISTDLTYYVRGGRISKAAGFVGNALNICPVMKVDPEGKLTIVSKARGVRRAVKELVHQMELGASFGTSYSGPVFLSESACAETSDLCVQLIKENFHELKEDPRVFDIGTTIGSHTGPGTVALFFLGESDRT